MISVDSQFLKNESQQLLSLAKRHKFPLSVFLSSLCSVTQCGIFVLDEGGFSIGGYLPPHIGSPAAEHALRLGTFPEEFFSRLQHDSTAIESGAYHSLHTCRLSETAKAYILLISTSEQSAYTDVVCGCVSDYLHYLILHGIGRDADISLLIRSLNDILNGKIRDIDNIKHILCDDRIKPYYISGVLKFDDGITTHERYLRLAKRLRALCVDVKPTIFKGKITVLMKAAANDSMIRPKWDMSIFRSGFNYSSLNALLEEEKAAISINNAMHELTLLPDAVDALMSVADISDNFKLYDDYDRIFFFSDYQSVVIAKRYFEAFLESHSPSALKLYIFPQLIPLLRYDYLNGQNLSTVLYKYITYNYDAAMTAKALYMHRNTVYNKIRQIQEITGLNFSNTASMSMIMDSLKLYFLLTSYFNINIIEVMFGKPPAKSDEKRTD